MRAVLGHPSLARPVLVAFAVSAVSSVSAGGQVAPESRHDPPAVLGLDHIPIAVDNLSSAAMRYRDLGFSLKPGRPHANGIQNEHAKFPDGTELELITASEATDALTTTYRRHLVHGDGPAFLAFFAPNLDPVARLLDTRKIIYRRAPPFIDVLDTSLAYIFFGPRNHSPTDRPEHFAHANTAQSLIAVWLADNELGHERRLLRTLGATLSEEQVRLPEPVNATVAHLPEGVVVLLPGSRRLAPGRRIVGATVRVRSLDIAARVLERVPLSSPPRRAASGNGTSLFLSPDVAHGLWLELREPSR
jgi:hypothetical protein